MSFLLANMFRDLIAVEHEKLFLPYKHGKQTVTVIKDILRRNLFSFPLKLKSEKFQ